MGTVIRNEISNKNKFYISKDRYLELKHFCLQYKDWEEEYNAIKTYPERNIEAICDYIHMSKESFVEKQAIKAADLSNKMHMVRKTSTDADPILADYIFKGVTENRPYTYLSTVLDIPCGRDMYYDRYRKFFWLLDKIR